MDQHEKEREMRRIRWRNAHVYGHGWMSRSKEWYRKSSEVEEKLGKEFDEIWDSLSYSEMSKMWRHSSEVNTIYN